MARILPSGLASSIPVIAVQFAAAFSYAQTAAAQDQDIQGKCNIGLQGLQDSSVSVVFNCVANQIDLATVLVVALSTGFVVRYLPTPMATIRRRVESTHPDDRKWLKDILGGAPGFIRYTAAIRALNERLDGWFGLRWGGQAFSRCLQLAVIYPFLLYFIALSFEPRMSEMQGFIAIGLAVGSVAGWRLLNRFRAEALLWVRRRLFWQEAIPPTIVRIFIGAFAFGGAIAVAIAAIVFAAVGLLVVVVTAGAPDGFDAAVVAAVVAVAAVGVVAFAVIVAGAGVRAFGVTFAGAVVVATLAIGVPASALAGAIALFLILPVLNAALDWASWGVTRFFLAKAARATSSLLGASILVAELLADFVIAAFLLIVLAISLTAGVELLNLAFDLQGRRPTNLAKTLERALEDPWGEGLFVTGMLITTLIPTFLHLVAGLAGVFFAWTLDGRALVARIPYDPAACEQTKMAEVFKDKLIRRMTYLRLWYIPAIFVVGLVMGGLFWLFSFFITPFGQVLNEAAYCGGALVNSAYQTDCPLW